MNNKGPRKHTIPAAPSIVNRKVPRRRSNADYRSREYLTEKEVGKVIAAAAALGQARLSRFDLDFDRLPSWPAGVGTRNSALGPD